MIDGSALHTLIYNDQGDPEDYLIIEVNPAFEILLGISRDTVINKTSREAYGVDNPPYFEIYSKVALSGKPEVFETYFAPLDKSFSISVYCPYKGSFATIFKNISERKKSEQELRIVLTKYQVLFDTFPIGITITDGAGNIIESNPIAETLLGISNEEQVKRTIGGQEWRIIKSDGAPMLPSEFASVRALEQGQQVTNMEMGIVKEDNQTTWLNVSATPIPLEGYGVAIVYNDITLRKLAERENERKQKLLEDSQRIGKIGGWEVNMDTQELKWTQEMYNIHEVDSTFFKPKVDQRFNFYTTETLPLVDKAMRQAIEQGGSYEVDSEIITAKGNRRSVKAIGKVDLKERRVFGLFQDITERKNTEEELRKVNAYLENLIDYANAPIIVWDAQFRITRFNHAFEFITGNTEAEVLGKSLEILFPPELVENSMGLIRKTLTGERWKTVEIQIQHRDKSVRTLLWNSATLFIPDSNVAVATIAQGQDITDRKIAEEALKNSEEKLLELNATKDKFFSIIAHDLKSPFNGILGFSDLLKDEARDMDIDSIVAYANIINSTAKQTFKLLENLLDWARLQQGGFHFESKTLSLNYIIRVGCEDLKYTADQKNITLINGIKNEIIITADERMVDSVIRNLISNAIKFTPKGGKIDVNAIVKNDRVEISVSDTGVGMTRETIDKLFKIETSFTSRGTENEKGSGLGLLLCKDFVEQHGGTICAESVLGKGSKLIFSIPLRD
jgi:PAS domain S-box-containing protein